MSWRERFMGQVRLLPAAIAGALFFVSWLLTQLGERLAGR